MSVRAIDLILNTQWAIDPEALETLVKIAAREGEGPEALAAKLGRPLQNARAVTLRDGTAILPVTGPIFRYANLFTEISGATSLDILARDFQTALDDPAVERVLLEINSPGGQASGIAEFAAQIRDSAKPVTAYVGDLAASAAYWIAAAADEVVTSSTALLGSIGVVATYRPETDGPIKVISSQSPLKQADPSTEAGRLESQRVVDELAAIFIADVARYRNVSPETVMADFGRGGVLVGASAVAAGMADRVGSFESLFRRPSAGLPGNPRRSQMSTYHTDLNTALGLPADASAEQAIVAIDAAQVSAAEKARTAGFAQGAQAERDRIQSVRAQLIPGHEALIEQLAFDGQTTGQEAAVAVLAAEKALREQHQVAQAAMPPPVPAALPAPAAGTAESKAFVLLNDFRRATGAAA